MLLRDMLSDDIVKNLNNMKNKKEDKKNKGTNKPKNQTKGKFKPVIKQNKDKAKVENKNNKKENNKKKTVNKKDSSFNEYREKRYTHFIVECPYCASKDLELTGNNYYYCENCGIKVDKKYDF